MTEHEKSIEAAAPVRPIQIGEHVYLISQPSLSLLASISAVLQKRIVRTTPIALLVNDPAYKLLPAAAQIAAATEAAKVQVAGEQPVTGQQLADELLRPESLTYAVWLLARGNHPDLRLEEVRAGITDDNAPAVFAEFNEASGMAALGGVVGLSG